MVTPLEAKRQSRVLGQDANDTVQWVLQRTSGTFESRRLQLLDTAPAVIGYYSEAVAAVATDAYMDARAGMGGRFVAEPVVLDRTVKIRRGIAWASVPLGAGDFESAAQRLERIVLSEVVRPQRDTVLGNRSRDPLCVGWKRITSGSACGFCKALADKGAVYREETATFAAHDDCNCTAAPVFRGGDVGPEASVMQYMASGRTRTAREKAAIRDWAAGYE